MTHPHLLFFSLRKASIAIECSYRDQTPFGGQISNLAPFTQMRPVLTKWATSRQETTGDTAHWICQKSIENKGISQGNNGFWTPIKHIKA